MSAPAAEAGGLRPAGVAAAYPQAAAIMPLDLPGGVVEPGVPPRPVLDLSEPDGGASPFVRKRDHLMVLVTAKRHQ